jgi:hypothetical protein
LKFDRIHTAARSSLNTFFCQVEIPVVVDANFGCNKDRVTLADFSSTAGQRDNR